MDRKDKTSNLWSLAAVAALKRAQEIAYEGSGELIKGEKLWYEVPFFEGLDKATIKSCWRHYYQK